MQMRKVLEFPVRLLTLPLKESRLEFERLYFSCLAIKNNYNMEAVARDAQMGNGAVLRRRLKKLEMWPREKLINVAQDMFPIVGSGDAKD